VLIVGLALLCVLPAVAGFVMGRWVPFAVRLLPVPFVLWRGYYWCRASDHHFGMAFLTPLAVYVIGDIVGLARRAEHAGKRFWQQYNLDWMALAAAGLTLAIMYLKPSA